MMRIVPVREVIQRNSESIDTVTALLTDWFPIICEHQKIDSSPEIEIVVMPMPYVIDELQTPVQGLVFYEEDDMTPSQIQLAGIWLAGALYTDEDEEEYLEVFSPGDDRFTRSVLETLTVVLLECQAALDGGLTVEARPAVRQQLKEQAVGIIAELLGPPPDAWLDAPPPADKKVLN